MRNRKIIWVTVNANNVREAEKIGMTALKKRLCASFGITPRIKSVYYWPPKSGRLEETKGPLLTLETLPKHYAAITKLVKKLHSDKVPFIGQWEMKNVDKSFYQWLKNELRP